MAVVTTTGRKVVTRVLSMLQIVPRGGAPSSEDLDAGLDIANDWLDGLKTERRTIFQVGRNVHNLVSAQQQYTIGSGANFNQERPLWIEGWSILPSPGDAKPLEIPMGRPMTLEQWKRVAVKGNTSGYPTSIYFDYSWANTTGFGRIEVYPVPTSSTPDIVLYTPTPLAEFADLDTEYSFPPGYRRAIHYSLCGEFAPNWEVDDEALLTRYERIAKVAMGNVKRANYRPKDASFDPALTGIGARGRNIYDLS